MKKIALSLLALAAFTLNASENKNIKPLKSDYMVYMGTGSSVAMKEVDNLEQHMIQVKAGSRLLGEHAYDLCSTIGFNHNFLETSVELNYLFSPEAFFGAYVGFGAKGGISIAKNYVWARTSERCEQQLNALSNRVLNTTVDTDYPVAYVASEYSLQAFADVPLIFGYKYTRDNKHHFLQASINKDLKVSLMGSIGF